MNIAIWPTIIWAAPQNSIYFILFAAILVLLAYRWWRMCTLIMILGKRVDGQRFLQNLSFTRVALKNICWALALFFLFLTLLHPCWNKKEETVIQEGRDLFIALDISASMLAQDVAPNRLLFAKEKIRALVNALASERIGLILFSGSSLIQCPLTRDHDAFFMYLDQIDVDTISSGTTALDGALCQALTAFEHRGTQKNKLLVIFTDGEDFSSNLAASKKSAQEQGVTIFTIGVGTSQGAPIPLFDARGKSLGHIKDKKGTVVISRLNEGILHTLAGDVGGIYIHASPNSGDLDTLISLVQKKEKEKIEERKLEHHQEQYPWFLLVSFILLVCEWLL